MVQENATSADGTGPTLMPVDDRSCLVYKPRRLRLTLGILIYTYHLPPSFGCP